MALIYYPSAELLSAQHNNPALGIYYIRAISDRAIGSISQGFYDEYAGRAQGPDPLVVYIGKATGVQGLYQRLQQELYQRGHGTFFRSLGGVMGKNPMRATNPAGIKNYRFPSPAKDEIIQFIEHWLEVAVVELPEAEIKGAEQCAIAAHQPIFNVLHNPAPSSGVQANRDRCRRYAGEHLHL